MNIQLDQVSFYYPSGVKAIDGVSLEIASGEFLALVGENGAGKSTLVKQMNALLRPDEGEVRIDDTNIADFSTAQLAQKVSFLFQNPDEQLFERSVAKEVAFGPSNLGLNKEEVKRRVVDALERVGLADQVERHPYDLQYTDRKLIALAASLAMEAPIMILDEPTVGQDAIQRKAIGTLLDELHAEGRSIILISHDLDFCAAHAKRVIVMAEGRILLDGPSEEVLTKSETLSKAAVIAPQLVRLAQGLNMPNAPLKVDQFLENYVQWKANK